MSDQPISLPDSWHLEPSNSKSAHLTHRASTSVTDPWNPSLGSSSASSGFHPPPVLAYPQPVPMQMPPSADGTQSLRGAWIEGGHGAVPSGDAVGRGKGKGKEVIAGPLSVSVLADMMDSSRGRDKILKCAQYSMKTYLYLLSLVVRVRPLSRYFLANRKRVSQAVSSLSLTRKCLLLLNPLHPLSDLLSPEPTSATTIIRHLIDLASAISDDLFCLSRLGLVNKRLGKRADRWANRFWFLTTIMGLYKIHLQTLPRLRAAVTLHPRGSQANADGLSTSYARARKDLVDAEWTNRKLLADLVFVSYDVLNLSWFEEPVKCAAGLLAAFISTNKLYDQHWQASLGKG